MGERAKGQEENRSVFIRPFIQEGIICQSFARIKQRNKKRVKKKENHEVKRN